MIRFALLNHRELVFLCQGDSLSYQRLRSASIVQKNCQNFEAYQSKKKIFS